MCVCDSGGTVLFVVRQKTAYEMRISDWSSDVCSSDLYRINPARMVKPDAAAIRLLNFKLFIKCPTNFCPASEVAPMVGPMKKVMINVPPTQNRSEERRVGKEWVSPFRSRLSPYH